MNWEPIQEALFTSFRVGAIILPLFLLVDWLNHKYGHAIQHKLERSKKFMPFFAALFGMLPGCNIAVVIAILFSEGVATLGTLVATIIAISDEALYVFIPLGFDAFVPIMVAKFVVAVIAGYLIDFFPQTKIAKSKIEKDIEVCCAQHAHHDDTKGKIVHSVKHTVRVMLIVFTVMAFFNFISDTYGTNYIKSGLDSIGFLEPAVAALIGLIPGCGTSIAIATLYVEKIITFGAAVAGLSTASGEVFVVLAARGVKSKNLFKIAAILVIISTTAGLLLNSFQF